MAPATPYLVVDREVLARNVADAAEWATRHGITLRPHVKTHKLTSVARLQLEAGATGISVATVGEAEVFTAAGVEDVFIAYPLWLDEDRGRRLAALPGRITVGIDSAEAAGRLAHHRPGCAVLVEVDSGHHRSGVRPEDAAAVASAAVDAGLEVRGAFTFPGHAYSPGAARAAADDEGRALARAAGSLAAAGHPADVLSGGSTPTLAHTDTSVVTEARPGVYVFGDAQQWELGTIAPERVSLTVHATVVSHAGARLVLDSGSKVLGADRAPWASGFGRLLDHPDATIVLLSEHHAVVEMGTTPLPRLGSTVRVVPNHVCNAVNLVDEVWLDDRGLTRLPVAARGRNG